MAERVVLAVRVDRGLLLACSRAAAGVGLSREEWLRRVVAAAVAGVGVGEVLPSRSVAGVLAGSSEVPVSDVSVAADISPVLMVVAGSDEGASTRKAEGASAFATPPGGPAASKEARLLRAREAQARALAVKPSAPVRVARTPGLFPGCDLCEDRIDHQH